MIGPLLLLAAFGCGDDARESPSEPSSTAEPTFCEHIAPLVFEKCTPCHRPGEAAPFSLTNYAEVKRRVRQIGIVTESRFMPPWLPAGGAKPFANDRSLTQAEIDLFATWIAAGAPEGDPQEIPELPKWERGWQLGKPDIELSMETFVVPEEGRDVYRNFVIRSPVQRDTWVRSVEFQPDNRVVLHHLVLFVDDTGTARALDDRDPQPGYVGMDIGNLRIPGGQFVTWLPGKEPTAGEKDIAFLLRPHTDIVLQLHLRPSGRPEPIQVRLGLFEAETPPTRFPMTIRMWSRDIDIPAGVKDFLVEASYQLPVDVQVLGVYPHAHYLGDDLQGYAKPPGGDELHLIDIPAWDFNWQEEYFYSEPLFLPAGTELSIRYLFDNTADNPLNPYSPPRRVVHGFESSDEMAELLLSVLPSEKDRPILWDHFERFTWDLDLSNYERHAAEDPDDPSWHHDIATYCLRLGRTEEAVRRYELLCEAAPDQARPLQRLGQARLAHGDLEGCLRDLRRALELDPSLLRARLYLGQALLKFGRTEEAIEAFHEVLDRDPGHPMALSRLGEIQVRGGNTKRGRELFEKALARNPQFDRALIGLGYLALAEGRAVQAGEVASRVLYTDPAHATAHHLYGRAFEDQGNLEEALRHLELALRFDPAEAAFARDLERVRRAR